MFKLLITTWADNADGVSVINVVELEFETMAEANKAEHELNHHPLPRELYRSTVKLY